MIINQHNLEQVKQLLVEAGLDPVETEFFQHKLRSLRPTRRHANGQEVVKIQMHYFTCKIVGDKVDVVHDGHCNQYGDFMVG